MDAQSSQKDFNLASGIEKQQRARNYSETELMKNFENYLALSPHNDRHVQVMKGLFQKYQTDKGKDALNEYVQNLEFDAGVEKGIQKETQRHTISYNHEIHMQTVRNDYAMEARSYYHENYGLGLEFEREADKDLALERE